VVLLQAVGCADWSSWSRNTQDRPQSSGWYPLGFGSGGSVAPGCVGSQVLDAALARAARRRLAALSPRPGFGFIGGPGVRRWGLARIVWDRSGGQAVGGGS